MQLFEYLARRLGLYGERQKNYAVLVYRVIDELRRSGISNKGIALDLGCGPGFYSRMLSLMGFKVVALDIDCELLTRVKRGLKTNPNVFFICADAHYVPLREGSLDIVIALSIFEHLENPEKAIATISHLLKENGILIVQLPNLDWFVEPHTKFLMFLVPKGLKERIARIFIKYYVNWDLNLKRFLKLAINYNLAYIKMIKYYHGLKTPPWPPSWFLVFIKVTMRENK